MKTAGLQFLLFPCSFGICVPKATCRGFTSKVNKAVHHQGAPFPRPPLCHLRHHRGALPTAPRVHLPSSLTWLQRRLLISYLDGLHRVSLVQFADVVSFVALRRALATGWPGSWGAAGFSGSRRSPRMGAHHRDRSFKATSVPLPSPLPLPDFFLFPAPSLPFLNNSVLSAEPGRRVRWHQGAVGPSRWPASRPGQGDAIHRGGGPAREVGPAAHTVDPGWGRRAQSEAPGRACRSVPCARVPWCLHPPHLGSSRTL